MLHAVLALTGEGEVRSFTCETGLAGLRVFQPSMLQMLHITNSANSSQPFSTFWGWHTYYRRKVKHKISTVITWCFKWLTWDYQKYVRLRGSKLWSTPVDLQEIHEPTGMHPKVGGFPSWKVGDLQPWPYSLRDPHGSAQWMVFVGPEAKGLWEPFQMA